MNATETGILDLHVLQVRAELAIAVGERAYPHWTKFAASQASRSRCDPTDSAMSRQLGLLRRIGTTLVTSFSSRI